MEQHTSEKEQVTGLDPAIKMAVWEKAVIVPNFNPAVYRKDRFGAWIKWDDFECNKVEFSLSWSAVQENIAQPGNSADCLVPVQWENALIHESESDNGRVTASGIINIKV